MPSSAHTGGDPVVVGQYKTPGVVKGVFVSGAYPYVVDGPSGLEVFDISGNKPIRLGSCNTSESIGYGRPPGPEGRPHRYKWQSLE